MGGAQYQAKCLVGALISTGRFDVNFLSRKINKTYQPQGYKLFNISDKKGLNRYGFIFDSPRLLLLLKRIKPDIIYQRVGCAYTGVASYYACQNNCRMVWHVAHDIDIHKSQYLSASKTFIKYIEKKMLDYGIRNATDIVTQTQYQDDMLYDNYKRRATAVIPNFHPLPTRDIQKHDPVKILWVANLKPWKQPDAFIKLARSLEGKVNAKFIMIGAPAIEKKWHDKLLAEISLASNLVYLGERTQDEVNQIMQEAHIFVNTSLHEGFANTFIQAWLRKVPVVSTNVNPDAVFNSGEIGILSNTEEQLREDVLRLIQDASLRTKMGNKAQKYAIEKHSEKNIDLLIDILDPEV